MSKEIYFAEHQRIYEEALENGMTEREAEEKADRLAYEQMNDIYWDLVDQARQRRKDER